MLGLFKKKKNVRKIFEESRVFMLKKNLKKQKCPQVEIQHCKTDFLAVGFKTK